MPKNKGKSSGKVIIGIVLVVVVAVAIIGWHDGMIGVTPIEDILEGDLLNGFDIDDGTAVTIKGTIVSIAGDWIIVNDGTGSIGFEWSSADDFEVDAVVVVRGVTDTQLLIIRILNDVTSVQQVWLFP